LLPAPVDCQDYNAVHVQVLAFGTNPSAVVEIQGSDAPGGVYLPLFDPSASRTITSNTAFEVVVGVAFVKVSLTPSSGSFTITVTPYIMPGQSQLSVLTMAGA